MQLVSPGEEYLDSYVAALRRGWNPDDVGGAAAAKEELERIATDPAEFLASFEDREAQRGPVTLPDGRVVRRLPGFRKWMWDGEVCGSIGLRWQQGTPELPPHCLGHIGYAVVPWRRNEGLATEALRQLLPEAWSIGLPYVEISTDGENIASQRVILANQGVLAEEFTLPREFGAGQARRYRIFQPC